MKYGKRREIQNQEINFLDHPEINRDIKYWDLTRSL